MKSGPLTVLIFTAYLIGSSLTFGYLYNTGAESVSSIGAFLWPFYWVFRVGIELTKNWTF